MKNRFSSLAFWGAAALLVVYLLASVVPAIFSTENVSVSLAESVRYDDCITVSGIVLREETLLTSSSTPASVIYKLSDGDRAAKGDVVATYSSQSLSSQDERSLVSLDREISLLEKSVSSTTQYDLKALEASLNDALRTYLDATESGNLSVCAESSDDLLSVFIRRDIKVRGDKNYYTQLLSNCKTAKASILRGNSATQTSVKATQAGFFTSTYDGYEFFSAADYATPSVQDVDTLLASSEQPRPTNYIGKLQRYSVWSFLCTVDADQVSSLSSSTSRKVRFQLPAGDEIEVTMTLKSVSEAENGRVALRFESSYFNNEIFALRLNEAKIVLKTHSGFRVSKDSIRVCDGQSGVYVLSGVRAVFKPIDVLYAAEDGNFAVVSVPSETESSRTLILNDSVIVGGKEIYDGKIVNIN